MRVLVGCEYSGAVRSAFRKLGHEAWSCDLLACMDGGEHIQGDVLDVLADNWDLAIFHPPCTDLAVSGARYFAQKRESQGKALDFVRALMHAPIPLICLENPVSIISSKIRKPDQIIHPFEYGHPEAKTTCLWLKGLPHLVPTAILEPTRWAITPGGKRVARWENQTLSGQNKLGPSEDRWKIRSTTYQGIADAMAQQWGGEQ